jgi:hypothetical protein
MAQQPAHGCLEYLACFGLSEACTASRTIETDTYLPSSSTTVDPVPYKQ